MRIESNNRIAKIRGSNRTEVLNRTELDQTNPSPSEIELHNAKDENDQIRCFYFEMDIRDWKIENNRHCNNYFKQYIYIIFKQLFFKIFFI